jgi:hypothetical protein
MTRSKKLLPAALAALLLLSACELVDAVEVAVSGPHCGSFDYPAELENQDLSVLDHRFNWDRLDGMLAVLEPYEDSHGPHILFALAVLYVRKAATLSNDPAYFRRGVRLFHWAALCGQAPAVLVLSEFYSVGPPFVDIDPELAACLDRAYNPLKHQRALIPGWVWGCGIRVEDLPE